MFSGKGQESAPFELLIAIIVMTFVIIVGFNALNSLNKETCEGTLDQNLEQIKTAIESVVKNQSTSNVSFSLPSCFSEQESSLRILEKNSEAYCSSVCGGSLAECTVLEFSNPHYSNIKCLRISSATNFPEGEPCDTQILEGGSDRYEIVNWKAVYTGQDIEEGFLGTIPEGQYTLVKQHNLFSSAPEICVYRRT